MDSFEQLHEDFFFQLTSLSSSFELSADKCQSKYFFTNEDVQVSPQNKLLLL